MKTYAVAMLWIMPDGGTCLGSAAIVAPDAAMAAATLVANSRPDPDARFDSISVQVISEEFMVKALAVMREQPGEKVVSLRPVEPQACSTCGKYPCVCEDVWFEWERSTPASRGVSESDFISYKGRDEHDSQCKTMRYGDIPGWLNVHGRVWRRELPTPHLIKQSLGQHAGLGTLGPLVGPPLGDGAA